MIFLRESVFWRFVLQLFRHTGLESVPTLQGDNQHEGDKVRSKNCARKKKKGRSSVLLRSVLFFGGIFYWNIGVASSFSAGAATPLPDSLPASISLHLPPSTPATHPPHTQGERQREINADFSL